jgi:hypothetical protein
MGKDYRERKKIVSGGKILAASIFPEPSLTIARA